MIATTCTCLAHGCAKPDQCLRHVAIRRPGAIPQDRPVAENACALDYKAFIPLRRTSDG